MVEPPSAVPFVWALCGLCALYFSFQLLRFGHREKHLPPGPPTIPILGNAHLLAGKDLFRKFKEWGDQYGSVYSLKVGKGTMVVLNSKRAVHDLVDKRSAIYSDRPQEQQLLDAFGNENFGNLDADLVWRTQRKIVAQFLAPSKLDGDIARISEAEISTLMHDLLIRPDEYRKLIKRCTASTATILLYGQRAASQDDFWAMGVYRTMEIANKAIEPGSYPPTEQFPILKLIPSRWNRAKARATECFQVMTSIWVESKERVERRRSQGDKRDSLIDRMLDGDIKSELPIHSTKFANFFGSVMQGAADTSAIAMLTNIMYLAKHPGVQAKARVELDEICGTERLPTWSDFQAAPYVNCIIKEGLRIHPPATIGVPHRLRQDDWYEGMLIPKGSMIIIPAWALGRSQYDDPDTYNPDRYLNHPKLAMDYAGSSDYENRDHYAYGAGRRICVGIQLAERTQWRITARLLWAFNIEPGIDEKTGENVEIDTEAYEEGFLAEPKPFKVRITPRSRKHAEVIKRELEDVKDFLKNWE